MAASPQRWGARRIPRIPIRKGAVQYLFGERSVCMHRETSDLLDRRRH